MNMGMAIRRIRKTKTGLSQIEFAKATGISQTYLSQIETDKKMPSMKKLYGIAAHLNVPIPILFWFSLTEYDIPDAKKEHLKSIKPIIDAMIDSII